MATITRQIEELRIMVESMSQSINTRLTRLETQVEEMDTCSQPQPERAFEAWTVNEDVLLNAAVHNLARAYAARLKRSERAILSRIEQSIYRGGCIK